MNIVSGQDFPSRLAFRLVMLWSVVKKLQTKVQNLTTVTYGSTKSLMRKKVKMTSKLWQNYIYQLTTIPKQNVR